MFVQNIEIMERCGDGGKNSNRVIEDASEEEIMEKKI